MTNNVLNKRISITIKMKPSVFKTAKYQAIANNQTISEFFEERILSGVKVEDIVKDVKNNKTASEINSNNQVA
jgi:capsular polysaccharide biosynthesis protein